MLTWVYYASFVVLLGAELTHGLALSRERPKGRRKLEKTM
jgi:uncharacterized BrkB/YihY/UPF0761 family membrane protein